MDGYEIGLMMEQIDRIARCPVCLETAKSPVAQCVNGHISCGGCRKELLQCSVCRGSFIVTINRVIEELLNALPKPCLYNGCKTLAPLERHLQICGYRPINCKFGYDQSCNWSGMVKQLETHIHSKHPRFCVTYKPNQEKSLHFYNFDQSWNSLGVYHTVDEESFLFYAWKRGNEFCHSMKHIQRNKLRKEYFFSITYKNGDQICYKSLLKSTPLREEESVEHNPVVFLLSDLNNLSDENRTLNLVIEAREIHLPKKT